MIRDITLGQYLHKESKVHKLDPRTKIIFTFLFMVYIFNVNTLIEYIGPITILLLAILFSKIPILKIIKGIKPILPLIIFTGILNLFFTTTGKVLWSLGFLNIREGSIENAAFLIIRIVLLITFSSILTLTTPPLVLTNGIEGLLSPLKRIKVPANEIAMMMSIALRFIPTLIEEADKIVKAQKARGADFESGNIIKRGKALIPVLIPLFINSFNRAEELANAMESRGYVVDGSRSKYRILKYKALDYFLLLSFTLFLIAYICWKEIFINGIF